MFKKIAQLAGCFLVSGLVSGMACALSISGAGATFPAPLYAKWAEAYRAATGNDVNYQAIGSGGGVNQIVAGTVSFGATDAPLDLAEQREKGLFMFPAAIGGVVPVVNIPGIKSGELHLTGTLLGDIYRGVIKRWNHPLIAQFNPGLKLPNLPITVVHRSDGSGTTFLFTTYLTRNAPSWKKSVGAGKAVAWPTGIGGKGNDGVAAFVRQTPGAIGYVEYAYVAHGKLTFPLLHNKAGHFIAPDAASFAAAAASATWDAQKGFYEILIDQPGAKAWPISGATFILVPRAAINDPATQASLAFFDWAFKDGAAMAHGLDYVPLPPKVTDLIRQSWAQWARTAPAKKGQ